MSSSSFLVAAGILCGGCALLVIVMPIATDLLERRRLRHELDAQERAARGAE